MLSMLSEKIRNEDSCYKLFLSLKTMTNILGLIRGTAFGYLLHQLNVSPFYLSLFFIISIFSNVICYFLFPFLHKKLIQPLKIIIVFERLSSLFLFFCIIYLIYLSTGKNGSYWILVFLNLLLCIPVYGFISASPLFVKETFSKLNYQTIIKFDFISFSIAKLIGFSLGVFIIDIKYIIFFFTLSFFYSIFLNHFYHKIIFIYRDKQHNPSVIFSKSDNKTLVQDTYYNPILTYLIVLIPSIFIVVINVQAVFLDKIYGIPFYLFPLIGAIGGLIFNLFVNKTLHLNVGNKFYLFGFILIVSFLVLAFSKSKFLLFPAIFLIGGVYTTLSTICTSRLYSYSKTREPQSISTYYMSLAIFNVLGTLIIGVLFEFFSVKNVFISWSIVLFLIFTIIAVLDKVFQLDNLKKDVHV